MQRKPYRKILKFAAALAPCVLLACNVLPSGQSQPPQTESARSVDGVSAVSRSSEYVSQLPSDALGVWSSEDPDGRAQCERYRALPATLRDTDEGLDALVGSVVVTPKMIHEFAEYGEGNFYVIKRVDLSGVGEWEVVALVGHDVVPEHDDVSLADTYRLRLQRGRLSWELEAPTENPTPFYFRCGDLRPDVYEFE